MTEGDTRSHSQLPLANSSHIYEPPILTSTVHSLWFPWWTELSPPGGTMLTRKPMDFCFPLGCMLSKNQVYASPFLFKPVASVTGIA